MKDWQPDLNVASNSIKAAESAFQDGCLHEMKDALWHAHRAITHLFDEVNEEVRAQRQQNKPIGKKSSGA